VTATGPGGGVVVVEAINVDFVVAAERLPGPGDTVVGPRLDRYGGGKGANAAVAAARVGAEVELIGAVGADDTGAAALEELRGEGIGVDGVAVLDGEVTGVALIVVDPAGENQIAVGAGANAALAADWVLETMAERLPRAGSVLVSTEIPGEAVGAAVQAATAAEVRCVLNAAPPIPAVLELLEAGPLLTPNASELAELARLLGESAGPELAADPGPGHEGVADRARAIGRRTGAPVVVTLGGDGAMVVTPDGQAEPIPPRPAEVRDTTGAGDTFNGVLAAHLATGAGLGAAVRAATAAASLSVAHVGARAGMPRAAAVAAALDPIEEDET